MKKITLGIAIFTILFASAFTVIESVNWKVKEDTYAVNFKGGKVEGGIKGLKATILFDEANPEKSKITATMDVNTINTGNGMMNKHAKSEEALNAEKFGTITFETTSISKNAAFGYRAIGKLTIKGVTKDIAFTFLFENKATEPIFKGKFSIEPKDYNITRSGTPDKLDIELSVPVTK
jgi:polyisoprenoid-binding protein YceI